MPQWMRSIYFLSELVHALCMAFSLKRVTAPLWDDLLVGEFLPFISELLTLLDIVESSAPSIMVLLFVRHGRRSYLF